MFVERHQCISCASHVSRSVASGTYGQEPLRSFIANDPWGENPLPLLEHERWDLRECSNCRQRWHGRILSPEWNEVRFTKWMSEDAIKAFEAEHGGNQDATRDVQHALRLKDRGVKRVLDFGCGFGEFLQMCQMFGMKAVGVDRSIGRRSGAGIEVFAELEETPGQFDAITMFEVLEHLDGPLAILKTLRSRLNLNGVMIVEVPDTSGVDTITDRESYCKIHPLDHINAFTPDSLVKIMRQAGFRPIAKAPAFVTTSLKRVGKDVAKAKLKQNTTQRYFQAA